MTDWSNFYNNLYSLCSKSPAGKILCLFGGTLYPALDTVSVTLQVYSFSISWCPFMASEGAVYILIGVGWGMHTPKCTHLTVHQVWHSSGTFFSLSPPPPNLFFLSPVNKTKSGGKDGDCCFTCQETWTSTPSCFWCQVKFYSRRQPGRAHTMHVPYEEEFMALFFFYPPPQSPATDAEGLRLFFFFPNLFAAPLCWQAHLAFIMKGW